MTTLAEQALVYLREGPRPSLEIVHDVLGLRKAGPAVAERLAVALLGADPRFSCDMDGYWALVPEPAWFGVPVDSVRFAVVDVETTGMRARGDDRITEMAVVHVDGPRIALAFESLVNPARDIPWRIQQLTGITDDAVAAAPVFEDIADRVTAALAGRVFVAHHARFDWAFVSAALQRAHGVPIRMPRLCTVRLARRLVPEVERRNLDTLIQFFGVDTARRHRAADDALATAHVLRRLLARAGDRGLTSWQDVDLLAR